MSSNVVSLSGQQLHISQFDQTPPIVIMCMADYQNFLLKNPLKNTMTRILDRGHQNFRERMVQRQSPPQVAYSFRSGLKRNPVFGISQLCTNNIFFHFSKRLLS
jgi:hypothetical protein